MLDVYSWAIVGSVAWSLYAEYMRKQQKAKGSRGNMSNSELEIDYINQYTTPRVSEPDLQSETDNIIPYTTLIIKVTLPMVMEYNSHPDPVV